MYLMRILMSFETEQNKTKNIYTKTGGLFQLIPPSY